jgi:hypothetical protein
MKNPSHKIPQGSLKGIAIILFASAILSCAEEPVDATNQTGVSALSLDEALSSADAKNANVQQTFTAHLTGDQERPTPVTTDGSGQAIFKLSKDGTSLSYKVIVNNIENITQAHIHCGSTADAGPVITFLFGFVAEGITRNGVLAEGVVTSANIIARPDSPICSGGVATFDQLIEKMKSGHAYINVHTIAHPPGEIRGQIK